MGIPELIFIGFALSMDAFAVSICKGLAIKRFSYKVATIIALWFAFFQALMPAVGFALGSACEGYISTFDHWIAFILLSLIGVLMIKESFYENNNKDSSSIAFNTMLILAIATSIDALVIGISFGILPNINLGVAISSIGTITFLLCVMGVKIGSVFGAKYKGKAEFIGGAILIIIGLKILFEHLGEV